MKRVGIIFIFLLLSCVLRLPSIAGKKEFKREDKNVEIKGIFDMEGTYEDGFPYHFKKKYYILWERNRG